MIDFLAAVLLLSLQPGTRYRSDRREFDGYRYTSLCAGLYQRPVTWVCVEVAR